MQGKKTKANRLGLFKMEIPGPLGRPGIFVNGTRIPKSISELQTSPCRRAFDTASVCDLTCSFR